MSVLKTLAGSRCWRAMLRRRAAWLCGMLLPVFFSPVVAAEPPPSAEYQVKAVFLFNFAQFVQWPADAFLAPEAALVIGVLGANPFGTYLEELVTGEKVGARPLAVRVYQRVEDITDCHLLFIARSEAEGLDGIIARLKGRSILTVSDADTFTRRGGMVRFVTEEGKIRLRINVEAAKASRLTISSKVLRPATIVTAEKD